MNFDLQGIEQFSLLGRRVTTPSNTAYASVYAWCDTLPTDSTSGFFPNLILIEQDQKIAASTSVVAYDKALRGGKGGTIGASLSVIYCDANGIDISSIDPADVYLGSKSDSTKRYPATIYSMSSTDNDRLVFVEYMVSAAAYRDVDRMVVQNGQVKDKLGNFAARKTFAGLAW